MTGETTVCRRPKLVSLTAGKGIALARGAASSILFRRKQLGLAFGGSWLAMLGALIGTRLLTTVASPNTLGVYNLALGSCMLVEGLLVRPYTQFSMREYHDVHVMGTRAASTFERFARNTLIRVVVVAVVLAYGLQALNSHFITRLSLPTMIASGVYLIGSAFVGFENGLLTTKGRLVGVAAIGNGLRWGIPLLGAALVYLVGDSGSVLMIASATFVIALAICLRYILRSRQQDAQECDLDAQRNWSVAARHFALPLIGVGIFSWIVSIGDRYLLGYFTDAATVGTYSAAYGLASMPIVGLWGAASQILYPIVYRAAAATDAGGQSQRRLFTIMLLAATVFAICSTSGFYFLRYPLVNLLLGHRFREGAPALVVWLAAGHGLLVIAMVCDLLCMASKRTLWMTFAYGFAALTNISLNLLWIPRWGARGAAYATLATYAVYLIVMVTHALKHFSRQLSGEKIRTDDLEAGAVIPAAT